MKKETTDGKVIETLTIPLNLYQKMEYITAELGIVAKNLNVETGGGKGYKAVSERDILDAVKPLEAKYGVYSYPCNRELVEATTYDIETKYGTKTNFFSRIKTTYRFVNTDDPSEYIDMHTFSVGFDSQDKGEGKAMTYGDKYALMKAYKISTGEDPDQNPSEEARYMRNGAVNAPSLAGDAVKKSIMQTSKAMGLEWMDVLKKTGWNEGEKLTKAQADDALAYLQRVSADRENA